MTFFGEEVEGVLTTHKIRGKTTSRYGYTQTAATLQVNSKPNPRHGGPPMVQNHFVCFASFVANGLRTSKSVMDIGERIDKLKRTNRCFLCLNRGHTNSNCKKNGKAECAKFRKPRHQYLCDEVSNPASPADQSAITAV
jgi:hypothetical protein